MPEQVRAASLRDEDHLHMVRAKGQRRLVRDFLSSKEGNLQNITVDYNLYEKLARDPEHGFVIFKQDVLKEGLQGGQINLPVNRCNRTGRFICGWTSRFLSANELSDDIQLLFGGAEAMKVTWLVAIKEEAAREGLAREEHIVQLLNQHVEEVIVLDSGDEADDGRPMPPIGLWRPSSARRNAIILFFDEMADEEGRGGRASLDTGVASAGAASSDAGAASLGTLLSSVIFCKWGKTLLPGSSRSSANISLTMIS